MEQNTKPSRLRLLRLAAGLTLDDVALRGGPDKSFMSRVERGYDALPADLVPLLAKLYRVPQRDVRASVPPVERRSQPAPAVEPAEERREAVAS